MPANGGKTTCEVCGRRISNAGFASDAHRRAHARRGEAEHHEVFTAERARRKIEHAGESWSDFVAKHWGMGRIRPPQGGQPHLRGMMHGLLEVLNVGLGDLRLTFDKDSAADRARARATIEDHTCTGVDEGELLANHFWSKRLGAQVWIVWGGGELQRSPMGGKAYLRPARTEVVVDRVPMHNRAAACATSSAGCGRRWRWGARPAVTICRRSPLSACTRSPTTRTRTLARWVPSDDVIAHLLMMRGDEHLYWRRCNQHPLWKPEAGV